MAKAEATVEERVSKIERGELQQRTRGKAPGAAGQGQSGGRD
jgi:hypothetical protein